MCGIGVLLRSKLEGIPELSARLKVLLSNRGPDSSQTYEVGDLQFLGSVLHIQGSLVTSQPCVDDEGNVLLWNGEVFGGIASHVPGSSDTRLVSALIRSASSSFTDVSSISSCICEALSAIHGPYAIIYYHRASESLHFARDPLGRRSLLTLTVGERVECIASTTATLLSDNDELVPLWHEVDVEGVYCLCQGKISCTRWSPDRIKLQRLLADEPLTMLSSSSSSQLLFEKLKGAVNKRVLSLNRPKIESSGNKGIVDTCGVGVLFSGGLDSVVLAAMLHHCVEDATAAIELINVTFLSSKRSDSPDRLAAISALIELQELFPTRPWRMIHVDVDQTERETNDQHVKNLIYPSDSHMDLNIGTAFWFASRGVGYLQPHTAEEKEASFSVRSENKTLLRLGGQQGMPKPPADSIKNGETDVSNDTGGDFSPAAAAAAAAAILKIPCARPGCKRIQKVGCSQDFCKDCCIKTEQCSECGVHRKYLKKSKQALESASTVEGYSESLVAVHTPAVNNRTPYTAQCRTLLIGIGADEQMGGYGRHRTCFNRGGFAALREELHLDQNRLWSRNLGRDDRCVADNGREAWFPYLDEEVVQYLQQLPLSQIVDFSLPPGVGDKRILREVGSMLGLRESAELVKRAIQFGTGIAKNTNIEYFGSNRKGSGDNKI